MPIFTIFFIILPQENRKKRIKAIRNIKKKKKKGDLFMSGEIFKKNIGRQCQINTLLEKKISGKIIGVRDNWVEIETKKEVETINIEFIEKFTIQAIS